MKRHAATAFEAAVLILLGVSLSMTARPALGQAEDPEATVRAREIAFAKTMSDRDLEAFRSFVSPEAIFFAGNTPLRGRDAVLDAWAPYFEGETAPFSWAPDTVQVLESGTLALSSGPVRDPSGEVVGRFNSIWRKDPDGVWRVVFDKGS
jgi:ketosteroid isomerase-like protein